jgi:hypothetical protein
MSLRADELIIIERDSLVTFPLVAASLERRFAILVDEVFLKEHCLITRPHVEVAPSLSRDLVELADVG